MSNIIKSGQIVREKQKLDLYREFEESEPEQTEEEQKTEAAYGINKQVERIYDEARQKAQQSAARILENAYAKRDKIVNTAEEDVKRIKKKAREDGLEEGRLEAATYIEDTLHKINESMAVLREEIGHNNEQLMNNMIEMSLLMTEKILHKRIEEDETDMIALAKEVVLSEKDKKNINIQVSAKMMHLTEELDKEMEPVRERYQNIIKVKASDLPEGALRLETSEGIIDASLFVQLENLRAQLQSLES